jgi:peptidoglycan LD-endopeptidase LytH
MGARTLPSGPPTPDDLLRNMILARLAVAGLLIAGSAIAGAVWLAPWLRPDGCSVAQSESRVQPGASSKAEVNALPAPLADPAVDPVAPPLDSALLEQIADYRPTLTVPVQGVRVQDLVDTYTQARSEGRTHDAIDIAAPRGTPVLAAGDGVVLKRFQSVRGGTALYQLAPDRVTIYYYAHLDRYAPGITEGQMLKQGTVLGYVGDTGNAGAGNYHLHFGVSTTADPAQYWGGVPRNPYPLLVDTGSTG